MKLEVPIHDELGNETNTIDLNDPLRAVINNLHDEDTMARRVVNTVSCFPKEYQTIALLTTIVHLAGALNAALDSQDDAHKDMREVIKGIVNE